MHNRRWRILASCTALLFSVSVGACASGTDVKVSPPSCASGAGAAIALAVGSYVTLDPAAARGCARFPANPSLADSAEYLVVPQSAATTANAQSSFTLTGGTGAPTAPAPVVSQAAGTQASFDAFLRRAEASRRYAPAPVRTGPGQERALTAGPISVGDSHKFSVCSNLSCSQFKVVTATAKVVTSHLGLFVDNQAPAGGLSQTDLDSLGSEFEHRLYAIDTTWFGRESDIDHNGVVMVLMTPVVNQLVDPATCVQSGYVAGFFFGLDLDPTAGFNPNSNQGEVFYSLVADTGGTLSCAHSVAAVKQNVPVTFIHEFQHMISYNQHVLLRGGGPEVLWLNEGLSHLAEELGGRSFLPGDSATFFIFTRGDLYNGFQYLNAPAVHPLVDLQGVGGLAQRGGYWLFVRYLVDQFGDSLTRALENTTLTGTANVVTQTGAPFERTVTRWGLALWVSGLKVSGFTPSAELTYASWNLHTTYAALTSQYPALFPRAYPLVPIADAGSAVNVTDQLNAGSGYYLRVLQPPTGAAFTLLFSAPGDVSLPSALAARLSVIRIR